MDIELFGQRLLVNSLYAVHDGWVYDAAMQGPEGWTDGFGGTDYHKFRENLGDILERHKGKPVTLDIMGELADSQEGCELAFMVYWHNLEIFEPRVKLYLFCEEVPIPGKKANPSWYGGFINKGGKDIEDFGGEESYKGMRERVIHLLKSNITSPADLSIGEGISTIDALELQILVTGHNNTVTQSS